MRADASKPMLSMQRYSAFVPQYSHPDLDKHRATPLQHAQASGQYVPANTHVNNNPISANSLQSPAISDESTPRQEDVAIMDEDTRSPWSRERESSSMELDRNVKFQAAVHTDSEPTPGSSSSCTTYSFAVISSPDVDVKSGDVTPKIEEIDDDDEDGVGLSSIKPSEDVLAPETAGNTDSTAVAPRKRGRPRKHPLPTPGGNTKIAKGRSKTGCITCRRRKKKCDETKPACLNCQKNAVVCEGYPPKEIWKSGRQKMEDGIYYLFVLYSLGSLALERIEYTDNSFSFVESCAKNLSHECPTWASLSHRRN